jgi:hypothetical protein
VAALTRGWAYFMRGFLAVLKAVTVAREAELPDLL